MRQKVPQSMVVSLLALTLGEERARTAWLDAVRGLGMLAEEHYAREQVMSVLSALSGAPGSVGVAARVARVRLDTDIPDPSHSPSAGEAGGASRSIDPQASSSLAHSPRIPSDRRSGEPFVDLVPFLAPSLGDEKTREVLHQYTKSMGLPPSGLTRDDANVLLEAMSQAAGLLGVVARFAKARLLLKAPPTR